MVDDFLLIPIPIMNKLAVSEVIKCNEVTLRYGLILSEDEARELIQTRAGALSSQGRIEFAGGIINKLIMNFCDSPFLSPSNYVSTLSDLIETFYYFKNETLDEIGDDELITFMKKHFDKNCQGSLELLQNRDLEGLARNIRYGLDAYQEIDDIHEDFRKFFREANFDE
ncbi:hypothetical protein CEB3_c35850 [Peptococcaceae bacterium CEB3]|nr:hypothetical protein CEB3_c35850 [Peptococcaceae bacterium CEB3]